MRVYQVRSSSHTGYVALALCGLDLGTVLRGTITDKRRALLVRTVAYWALYAATAQLGLVASRRLVRSFANTGKPSLYAVECSI